MHLPLRHCFMHKKQYKKSYFMDNSVKEILCDEWMHIVKSVFVNLGVFEPPAKTKGDIKLIYFLLCMRLKWVY